MNLEELNKLKEFLTSNKIEKNKIKSSNVDLFLQLNPKEFFCPICNNWHIWEGGRLVDILESNIPYYYICNNKEIIIDITNRLSKHYTNKHEIAFDLELIGNNSSASIELPDFFLVSNILFFLDDTRYIKNINFFALKFDEEDIEDILNIKKIFEKNNKSDCKNELICLRPTQLVCPICGKSHIWNGETLLKYTFDNPYQYTCPLTNEIVKLFSFNYSLCVIIYKSQGDNSNIDKIYIVKSLQYFSPNKEYDLSNKNIATICYKYSNLFDENKYHLGFIFSKIEVEELKNHNYLNSLYKKHYEDIELQFNPDIFKLIPTKYLCPICGKWHKFKTNYLFQNSSDFYKVYYEQICPTTNTIITIGKSFYEKYSYSISIRNIYNYLGSDTICILNFKRDNKLPRIYGTLYINNLNGKTSFGLEFDKLEFDKLIDNVPKYDINHFNNAIKKSYILATPYGIGTYDKTYAYVYDKVKKYVIHYKYYLDCENYLHLGNGTNECIQKVPVSKSDLNIGDSIYYNEKLYFVHELPVNKSNNKLQNKFDNSIIVMEPFTGNTLKINPYISENKNMYYIKLVMLSDISDYILPKLWENFK